MHPSNYLFPVISFYIPSLSADGGGGGKKRRETGNYQLFAKEKVKERKKGKGGGRMEDASSTVYV